jgi:hypothetical protein
LYKVKRSIRSLFDKDKKLKDLLVTIFSKRVYNLFYLFIVYFLDAILSSLCVYSLSFFFHFYIQVGAGERLLARQKLFCKTVSEKLRQYKGKTVQCS